MKTTGLRLAMATMIAATVLTIVTATARAQETRPVPVRAQEGITVTGTGKATFVPDIARISLGVRTQAKESAAATQSNATRTDAIVKAIRAAGVAEKDIRTENYNVETVYAQEGVPIGGGFGGGRVRVDPVIIGYAANNSVRVTVRRIADAGKVIDAATKAGANIAEGITLEKEDTTEAEDAALRDAVRIALRKARVMATAAGKPDIELVEINEGVLYATQPPVYSMARGRGFNGPSPTTTPISPGEQTITATVTVRFRFTGAAK